MVVERTATIESTRTCSIPGLRVLNSMYAVYSYEYRASSTYNTTSWTVLLVHGISLDFANYYLFSTNVRSVLYHTSSFVALRYG